jgi:hypothetical protein
MYDRHRLLRQLVLAVVFVATLSVLVSLFAASDLITAAGVPDVPAHPWQQQEYIRVGLWAVHIDAVQSVQELAAHADTAAGALLLGALARCVHEDVQEVQHD